MENDRYCLFCLDEVKNHTQFKINFGCHCKIHFHNECMKTWLTQHNVISCPLCRHVMTHTDDMTIVIISQSHSGVLENDTHFILPLMMIMCMFLLVLAFTFYSFKE